MRKSALLGSLLASVAMSIPAALSATSDKPKKGFVNRPSFNPKKYRYVGYYFQTHSKGVPLKGGSRRVNVYSMLPSGKY